MSRFLKYCNLDLNSLLKLPQQELSNLIIKYLVSRKISSQYKTVIMATIKHACEMNDVMLNWKKLKKFIKSEKTDNEINGKEPLTYARNTGFHTSDTTWYREKNKLEKLKLKRLYSIAKTGFEEQRFERIDKPELVEKLVFPELLMHKLLVLIIVKCHYKM